MSNQNHTEKNNRIEHALEEDVREELFDLLHQLQNDPEFPNLIISVETDRIWVLFMDSPLEVNAEFDHEKKVWVIRHIFHNKSGEFDLEEMKTNLNHVSRVSKEILEAIDASNYAQSNPEYNDI